MNCLSWNCQGLGGPWTVRTLEDHIRAKNPQIIFLMETRLSERKIDFLKNKLGLYGVAVSSIGLSGGLALLWRKDINVVLQSKSKNHIDVFVYNSGEDDSWRFTGFYGEPEMANRRVSWEILKNLAKYSNKQWLCVGDYNAIAYNSEKKGGRETSQRQLLDFRQALSETRLNDLGFEGNIFTWCNRWDSPYTIWERLDRACATSSWIDKFPYSRVIHMETINSDHSPICIVVSKNPVAPRTAVARRFKFEAMWLTSDECKQVVENSWQTEVSNGTNGRIWNKIERCTKDLKGWSISNFGEVTNRVRKLKKKIHALRSGPISKRSRCLEKDLKSELEDLLDKEDLMWRQRSKVHWLKEGDKNTRFFHAKASARNRTNTIEGLRDSYGMWCSELVDIERVVVQYFGDIFTSSQPSAEDIKAITNALDRKVDERMNQRLLQRYTAEEVTFALSLMHPLKSPGPNGLPVLFYQKFWNIIKNDVISATLDFLNNQNFHEDSNFTHVVLIPKCKSPTSITQFRPISLCNVIYKLSSKVIVNRLKPIMNSIISESQSAFVPSRLITDNVLAAFEVSHFMKNEKKGKVGHMSLKLDMSKAYDRVEWNFIKESMLTLGFDENFVKLIMTCITTVSYSFLINGEERGFVKPERGIRQGDPLSPYLFLFCAESLSALIKREEMHNHFKGISICQGAPFVSHLLFADDTLIFTEATGEAAKTIKSVLENYGKASGQEINFEKSSIVFSRNTNEVDILRVQSYLPMTIEEKHDKYLGLPMITGKSKKAVFGYIRDRIWERVEGWKEKILSLAGKEILIKAVLQAIPTYVMGCFKLPKTFIHEIESIIANYWWNAKEKRKIHWIKWSDMLLIWQYWRILQNPTSLISRILKARYFKHGDFLNSGLGRNPSYTWRSIWESKTLLEKGLRWRIGNGTDVKIWDHKWVPRQRCVKVSSPPVTLPRDSKVTELIDWDLGTWKKDLIESEFWDEDAQGILSIPLGSSTNRDKLVWHYTTHGGFTVRSAYHLAMDSNREVEEGIRGSSSSNTLKDWRWIWSTKIPNKIKIFVWRALKNALPVNENLQRRKMLNVGLCLVCHNYEETIFHALFRCTLARQIWALSGIPWSTYKEYGTSIDEWFDKVKNKCDITELGFFWAVCWAIWYNRNKIRLGEEWYNPLELINFVKYYTRRVGSANAITQPQLHVHSPIRWTTPSHGIIKLNFDGALFANKDKSGYGFIARNHLGQCVGWGSDHIDGILSPENIEAFAAKKAMEFATSKGWRNILLEGDCKTLIDSLGEEDDCLRSFGTLIADIKHLATPLDNFSARHINRIGNSAAHALAKLALEHLDNNLALPDSVCFIVNSDLTSI
ncbi:hypothetical protein ACJIZ3_005641 [Penstemon smallii]|uniref:Reverse transcriptase domain-containing protein n=1 Tax=Penstemon smallii TaxID=265156 RepID=A0ABD3S5I7_9LAMI